MKQFRWVLALTITTVIASCHKEISTWQPANSSGTETEIATQAAGTSSSCIAPSGLSASNIASTTATVNWNAVSGALVYTVHYKPTSSSTWIVATSGTYGLSANLYSLSANTSYDWRVYTNCSLTEASAFSTTAQFTTLGSTSTVAGPCPGPYDVSTNGAMSGAATINMSTDVKGTIAPANDVDYYKFTMNWYGGIVVWLTTLPANYDLAVFNSSGAQIGISQNKGSKNETISLTVNAGDYYVKVFPKGTANSATSCYTLRVQTIP